MSKRSVTLFSLLALLASPLSARAAQWSDDSFHYWFGTAFAEPGIAKNVAKHVLTFTHASGYKYGTNFLNASLLYSNTADPVRNTPSAGAAELYAIYRHTLSFGKISGRLLAFGPVRDLGITLGVDANTKNTAFAGRKIMPIGGLTIALEVPGFLNLDLLANKEWNTNGIVGKLVEFDVTMTAATAWAIPVYGPVNFEGFGSVNLPKGKDGFGNDTKTELLFHPKVMVDVGTLWGSKGWQVGAGWQYWLNKFGNDHNNVVGAEESAAFVEAAVHL